jgi:hypothetical protein
MKLTVALVLFVISMNLFFHRPLLESFLFAIVVSYMVIVEVIKKWFFRHFLAPSR